jgi:hypothetical protein
MKKTKLMFGVGTIALMIMLAVSPVAISNSTEIFEKDKIETTPELTTNHETIYVGNMYIEGTGHYHSSLVIATAVQNPEIKVSRYGSDVTFKAKYLLQCTGDLDWGYILFSVGGEASVDYYTEVSYDEGYLRSTVYDCKPGDVIVWILYVEYGDMLFPRSIVDMKAGGTVCSLQRRSSLTSTPLFLQFIERFPYPFPLLKQLSCRLLGNIMAIKGTIVCE